MESPDHMAEAADWREKVEIFESVDVFRAGTFKFENSQGHPVEAIEKNV